MQKFILRIENKEKLMSMIYYIYFFYNAYTLKKAQSAAIFSKGISLIFIFHFSLFPSFPLAASSLHFFQPCRSHTRHTTPLHLRLKDSSLSRKRQIGKDSGLASGEQDIGETIRYIFLSQGYVFCAGSRVI